MTDEHPVAVWFFGAVVREDGTLEPGIEPAAQLAAQRRGRTVLCVSADEWPTNDENIHRLANEFHKHLHDLAERARLQVAVPKDGKPN